MRHPLPRFVLEGTAAIPDRVECSSIASRRGFLCDSYAYTRFCQCAIAVSGATSDVSRDIHAHIPGFSSTSQDSLLFVRPVNYSTSVS